MTASFAGRTALVTGAGRGIGRATALGLAEAGARVAVLARSQDELDEVAGTVRAAGGTALVIRADVGDPGQLDEAAQRVGGELGPVDVLVNNAAVVWPLGPTLSISREDWATAVAVNVLAPVTLSALLVPAMVDRGWGRVVNVSSGIVAAPQTMPGGNAYATTKSALEAHTRNLAEELAGTGVTVNVYRPGSVDTAMQAWIRSQSPDEIGAALHQRFVRNHEQGAMLTPEHSAASLLRQLAGDGTGQIWAVDPAT